MEKGEKSNLTPDCDHAFLRCVILIWHHVLLLLIFFSPLRLNDLSWYTEIWRNLSDWQNWGVTKKELLQFAQTLTLKFNERGWNFWLNSVFIRTNGLSVCILLISQQKICLQKSYLLNLVSSTTVITVREIYASFRKLLDNFSGSIGSLSL